MALGLAVRDAGLPSCAGIVGWSPLFDLTHSMPSTISDKCEETDFVSITSFRHATSQVAGDGERLRDESIYLAHRCNEPTKYKGPHYNAGKFEKSPFQTPTNITFDLYEEMPHVFQLFDSHICSVMSVKRTIEFINRVVETNEPLPPSSFNRINCKGEINPLNENDKEVLQWKNI
ncbi:4879_t:CDS:2, partial [Funneliformis caledonium]